MERAILQCDFGYPGPPIGLKTRSLAALGRWRIRRSRQRQSWIPFRDPGRLLDFGCGAGMFLQEMQSFGWKVEGLDFSESVAQKVETETGIKVHVGTFPHADVAPESFDAVTMWNSLEHVYHPRETVRHASKALRPGGVLVVGVPNFDSWGYRTFQHEWHGLELPRHLTHFTPKTLTATLEAEGYRVLSIDQIARVGWVRRSARRAEKSGWGPKKLKWLKWKPIGIRVADWTERTGQADFIRAVAEKC
jgi:SAM-dependent methyltransferase